MSKVQFRRRLFLLLDNPINPAGPGFIIEGSDFANAFCHIATKTARAVFFNVSSFRIDSAGETASNGINSRT